MSKKPTATRRWRVLLGRGLGVLALSLLLHLLALQWAGGWISLPTPTRPDPAPVTVRLEPPPAPPESAPPPVAIAPVTKPRKPPPRRHVPPAPVVTATAPVEPAAEAVAAPAAVVPDHVAAAETPPAPPAGQPPVPAAVPKPRYQFRVPPPMALKYDVQALREGKVVYGHGRIAWRTDGQRYLIEGEAGVLFFTVLKFQSLGAIDDNGVSPEVYAEKRFRRDETTTNFQRDTGTISFTASDKSYPRVGGEQDRASVVWQLAAIGLGDASRFTPGAEIELFVAGVRDAEPWVIQVIGLEQTETPAGPTEAWHVVRVPRAGSYEQQLDIWLAPRQSWYPVRLRYTETNGDYLDMAVTALEPLTPI